MKKINLKNVVWKEGKQYVSWNLNTGISSFGDTRKEALSSLLEALELYFEDTPPSNITRIEKPDLVPLVFNHVYTNISKNNYQSPQKKWFYFCFAKWLSWQISQNWQSYPHRNYQDEQKRSTARNFSIDLASIRT